MTDLDVKGLVERLQRAILRAEDGAGTVPAKEAVKLIPMDWHGVTKYGREAATALLSLSEQLREVRLQVIASDGQAQEAYEAHVGAEERVLKLEEALRDADAWIGECYRAWAPEGVPEPTADHLSDGQLSRRGSIHAALKEQP